MSSSKIIKAAGAEQRIARFSFEPLAGNDPARLFATAAEFRPLFFAGDSVPVPTEGEGEPGAGPSVLATDEGRGPVIPEEELRAMLAEAREIGFEEGVVQGRREAGEGLQEALRALGRAAEEVGSLRERIVRESEDELLSLSVMLAKRIIQQEVSHDRRILARFVAEAVREISDQEEIVVCFHPDDCQVVASNRHLYLAGIAERKQLTIKPDDTIAPGGCVVDTATGQVDARIEAQLAELYRRLVEERNLQNDGTINRLIEVETTRIDRDGGEGDEEPQD